MKVNFDFNLTDSYGEELEQIKMVDSKPVIVDNKPLKEPISAIPLIAESMIHPNFVKSDYIRHVELRDKIKKEKKLDISKADFDLIKKAIECQTNSLTPIAKGCILLKFRDIDANNALPIPQESETKKEIKAKTEEKK